jgi:hypothetical protein
MFVAPKVKNACFQEPRDMREPRPLLPPAGRPPQYLVAVGGLHPEETSRSQAEGRNGREWAQP